MSRLGTIRGLQISTSGKASDVTADPEWRAEHVLAKQRIARRPTRLQNRLNISRIADAFRPKEKP